jgi:outer membrane lipoprotein-sorting protein
LVRIEYLNEESPLPELLKLAGFLRFDIEEIQERVYPESEVYSEYINGIASIRIRLKPRSQLEDTEPDRFLWLDQNTYYPLRFAVNSGVSLIVDFQHYAINQGVDPDSLTVTIPRDEVNVNDLTQ